MKKLFWIIPCILIGLLSCGPIPNEAESGLIITAPDGFAVNCASGYSRVVPHFCFKNNAILQVGFTLDPTFGTCRSSAISISGVTPSFILVNIYGEVRSNNAVALRQLGLSLYGDNLCATSSIAALIFEAREEVAVAANNVIVRNLTNSMVLPVVGGNIYYVGTNTNAGSNSSVSYQILGYYD